MPAFALRATIALLLSCGTAFGGEALPPRAQELLSAQHVPGLSWAVVKNGQVIAGTYGNASSGVPVTTDTYFHVASVTKVVVAATVMSLVEAGRVSLDAPIVTYLPDLQVTDERLRRVTVRQLLNHTSGISDVEGYDWHKPDLKPGALRRFVTAPGRIRFDFDPGKEFSYSNLNYSILGYLIEKVSRAPFGDTARRRVLVPGGAPTARLSCADLPAGPVAKPHVFGSDGNVIQSMLAPINPPHAPSSMLCTRADEMAVWALSATSCNASHPVFKQCQTITEMARPGLGQYGLGWFSDMFAGQRRLYHDGTDVGYSAIVMVLPDEGLSVAVEANFMFASTKTVAEMLLAQALGISYEATNTFPGREEWSRMVGRYCSAELECAELSNDADGLIVKVQKVSFDYEQTVTRLIPKPEWGEGLGYYIGTSRGGLVWLVWKAGLTDLRLVIGDTKYLRVGP